MNVHELWRELRTQPAGAWELHAAGSQMEKAGELEIAATAFDRAYGLAPDSATIRDARQRVLDRMARVERGLVFRYVPAGLFRMGSEQGDADERPVRDVDVGAFWISEAPITWAFYGEQLGWGTTPDAWPPEDGVAKEIRREWLFRIREDAKLRLQYCETETGRARDWRFHAPASWYPSPGGGLTRPLDFSVKPMIAVGALDAEELAAKLGWRLPGESEWEKSARGGLIGRRYAWGDEPPDLTRCDFRRMGECSILPPKSFPPNGYGLYAMCGTVWEWTATPYDALGYERGAPSPPAEAERVLRGGSWSDGPGAVTASFRMSRPVSGYRTKGRHAANIGFRLCL